MKVIQMIPTIAYGDAVGNDAIAMQKAIRAMGYETNIYAEHVIPPITKKTALTLDKVPELTKEDVILYHLSTGSQLNFDVANYPARLIVVYHNVTPPHYFADNDQLIREINEWAMEGVRFLAKHADYCLADSNYNKQELLAYGYKCPIDVLPILMPLEDYTAKPDAKVLKKLQSDKTTLLFTGRIAPNKCQQDVIRTFYYYKKYYNPNSRLILAGSFKEENLYYAKLKRYVYELGMEEDILFTGHTKFASILAYYRMADAFVCMSEHEGFCVPLVEAMLFDVPILAYNSSAIPDTLGGAGLLLQDKNPLEAAAVLHRLMNSQELRKSVIAGQQKRLDTFRYQVVAKTFSELLQGFLK